MTTTTLASSASRLAVSILALTGAFALGGCSSDDDDSSSTPDASVNDGSTTAEDSGSTTGDSGTGTGEDASSSVDGGLKWFKTCGMSTCIPSDAGTVLVDDAGNACPTVGTPCDTAGESCGANPQVDCGSTRVCATSDPTTVCPLTR